MAIGAFVFPFLWLGYMGADYLGRPGGHGDFIGGGPLFGGLGPALGCAVGVSTMALAALRL